ncbi:unnamed protein product [Ambrosiozyma monospora]|uniref:Unnamed protein product n=1 Tax=Ambrosiozyma monospora TaxID=43982 RepID=A0ACB5TX74_AMBMO|nr:unnamed protein product [Ambrosiozyma monospora]
MSDSILMQSGTTGECQVESSYTDTHWGARVSTVPVILVTSMFGAFFPMMASRYSFIRMPQWCYFLCKYFGSGVIIATAFMHLLVPGSESLGNDCLGGVFDDYPMAFMLCLICIFVMFFIELLAYRHIGELGPQHAAAHTDDGMFGPANVYVKAKKPKNKNESDQNSSGGDVDETTDPISERKFEKDDLETASLTEAQRQKEEELEKAYLSNLLNVFVLEFGILFHSVFVGLSLAVAGHEFMTLYIVIIFHQMFEGLGLGARIAMTNWPATTKWTPWFLCLGYGLTTPIAIGIGLGVRETYLPGSRTALIVNGVCDSISAGVLIYSGMVELMAHEFFFNDEFKVQDGFKKLLYAFATLLLGAGIMSALARWA